MIDPIGGRPINYRDVLFDIARCQAQMNATDNLDVWLAFLELRLHYEELLAELNQEQDE